MKKLLLLFLCFSCAHYEEKTEAPSWVSAVRSGEESMRVAHGSKIFYRRIAGGPAVSRQTSCELVVMKAQEDIKKEFPGGSVPHSVEVLFFDEEHQDCAVTLSVDSRKRDIASVPVKSPEEMTEEDVSNLLVERSETAIKFALTGLTVEEFEKFSKEKVVINNGEGLCSTFFRTEQYSIHGLTHVCWTNNNIEGYCTSHTKQCWMRTPQ
ncbi:MAG: hypothetical protein ACJ76H_12240 [Bacteriovoracaceae bacterium]